MTFVLERVRKAFYAKTNGASLLIEQKLTATLPFA